MTRASRDGRYHAEGLRTIISDRVTGWLCRGVPPVALWAFWYTLASELRGGRERLVESEEAWRLYLFSP
jgi:hypothetical protein